MTSPINICFVFDEKFADFFKVAALSIDRNTASPLNIYVVDCGISDQKKQELIDFKNMLRNVNSITFGTPERIDAIEQLDIPPWFSSAVFYRLAIPKVFPHLQRVIYLDCDIIAQGDIAELWDENLDGRPFGAVEEDGNFYDSITRIAIKKRLGINLEKKYYNSGVLLIDTKIFEHFHVFERVITCIQRSKSKFDCPEQDAMNICLEADEHMPLSPKYNFCPSTPLAKQCMQLIKSPILIHHSCAKPWTFNKKLIQIFKSLHIFEYSTTIILKFWEYADEIDVGKYNVKSIKPTLRFFWKRLFQPIEHFVAKGLRDKILRFFQKISHHG